MLAQNTLSGPGILPNRRRVYQYPILTINPFGFATEAR
jgi:hypothetical protein